MRASLKPPLLLAATLAALAGACSPSGAGLVLEFPAGTQAEASRLDLYVLHPLPAEDLCLRLYGTAAPIDPTSPELVRDATIEDVTVEEFLTGAGRTLEGLPSGDKVFFVRVEDSSGAVFLHGCLAANLGGGDSLVLPLQHLPDPVYDAPPDAPPADGPLLPPDAMDDPDLTVIVVQANNPSSPVPNARVVVTDGVGAPREVTAGVDGRAVFVDVAALLRPYDVTVVGEVVAGPTTYRAAVTLIDVAPTLSDGRYTMNVALETSPPAEGGAGSITGSVTGLAVDETAQVQARTALLGPYVQAVAAGSYAISNLVPETYSVALLVRNSLGQVVRLLVNLGISVGAGATTIPYNAAAGTPLDVPATVSLAATPAALGSAIRTLGLDVLLARGPIELTAIVGPTSPVSMVAPNVGAVGLLGSSLLFRYVAIDAAARLSSEARMIPAAANPLAVSLSLPSPPTITSPLDGAMVAEASAQTLALTWTSLFAGHRFVHVRLSGATAGTTFSWNLLAPVSTVSLMLPELPADLHVLVAGVSYTLTVTASSTSGSPAYAPSIAANYLNWTRAFDVPRRASHTVTFSVAP